MTEKKERILEAAALIFTKYGYKKSTIDEIVLTAGISKGLFYHYFPDKKAVYLDLYNTYVEIMNHAVIEKIDLTETDFLERLKQISHIRIDFINQYPNLWEFLYSSYYEQHPDVANLIKAKNQELITKSSSGAAANIDWTKLKKGITANTAIQIVTWIAEGFVKNINKDKLEFNKDLYLKFDEYIDLLKNGIYK